MLSLSAEQEQFKFVKFPLRKVDYMYREQGGTVAHLVFDLWSTTADALASQDLSLDVARKQYRDQALPTIKKLRTFKRFINELIQEWCKEHNKEDAERLFKGFFIELNAEKTINGLEEQEFYLFLDDVKGFLYDIANNAPYARKKCAKRAIQKKSEIAHKDSYFGLFHSEDFE